MHSPDSEALKSPPLLNEPRVPVVGKTSGYIILGKDGYQHFYSNSEVDRFSPRQYSALNANLRGFKGPMGDLNETYRKALLEEISIHLDPIAALPNVKPEPEQTDQPKRSSLLEQGLPAVEIAEPYFRVIPNESKKPSRIRRILAAAVAALT